MKRLQLVWLSCLLSLWMMLGVAVAKPKVNAAVDAQVGDLTSKILVEEYATADFAGASKKLGEAAALCDKKGCRPETRARVTIIQGMVASQMGNALEAKEKFTSALKLAPGVQLPERGQTPGIKAQWAEVKGKSAPTEAPKPEPAATAPPTSAAASSTVLPEGWKSGEAFKLALEATEAKEQGDYKLCLEKDLASLAIEDQPRTRLHLSGCQYRSQKYKDALREAQKALDMGIARKDTALMKAARDRVRQLIELMPHVTFKPPAGVVELKVKFDEREVPVESLSKKFSVDPGPHKVTATGTVNGFPSEFLLELDVKEKDLAEVNIVLTPVDAQITKAQVECMYRAKTQEEVQRCLPQKRRALVVHLGTDLSAYSDTNSVFVVSPGMNASLTSPTSGWNVGGNFLVDVVSAASPDIISYASPPFREKRYAGGVNAGYKFGSITAQAGGSVSSEPDYLSRTVGGAVLAELADKTITPRLGFNYTWDTIGRGPFRLCEAESVDDQGLNPCKRPFTILAPELGATFVMSPTTLLMIGGTVQIERGDQSKPYRHVPMFTPEIAQRVNVGQDIKTVDEARLSIRPNEQLPLARERYALAGRLIRRMNSTMTLRLEERLYADTWGILGSTTDGRYLIDIGKHLRVWPHGRLHVQSAANFYKLAYASPLDETTGAPIVPTYRTTDRELQSMVTGTFGGGARIDLGNPKGEIHPGITFTADAMYSYYFAALFLRGRTAVYGTLAFDVEF